MHSCIKCKIKTPISYTNGKSNNINLKDNDFKDPTINPTINKLNTMSYVNSATMATPQRRQMQRSMDEIESVNVSTVNQHTNSPYSAN